MRRAWLLLLGLPAGPRGGDCQDAPALRPGVVVRARSTDAAVPLVGRLVDLRNDTLRIELPDGAVAPVPRRRLAGLEVQRLSRAPGTGALAGGIVGAIAAGLFAAGFCSDPDTLCEADEYVRIAAFIGGPPLVAGAIIGTLIRRQKWVPVSPESIGFRLGVGPGGVRAAVRLAP